MGAYLRLSGIMNNGGPMVGRDLRKLLLGYLDGGNCPWDNWNFGIGG